MGSHKKSIAIIGSGAAGLAAAYHLYKTCSITVFEANQYIGGHANTVSVPTPDGSIDVDTGFIVFNHRNYPTLVEAFSALEIPTVATPMSFSVSCDQGAFEFSSVIPFGIFAQLRNLVSVKHWTFIREILLFNTQAKEWLDTHTTSSATLEALLDDLHMSQTFRTRYLLPMAAAIWSAPVEEIIKFPAVSFLRFYDNHGLLSVSEQPQWHTVHGGSKQYIKKITDLFQSRIRLDIKITNIQPAPTLGEKVLIWDEHGQSYSFDAVIIATHADQALKMLQAPTPAHQDILGAFRYQRNHTVLHQDPLLMPKRRRAWASWNYISNGEHRFVTYWMNHLQHLPPQFPLFVTLNYPHPITKPLASFIYEHPLFDSAALQAQSRLPKLQGLGGLWFCGSYTGYGFHEDSFKSGKAAAANILKRLVNA
jgi:predicted NAD/FAD-binding protein